MKLSPTNLLNHSTFSQYLLIVLAACGFAFLYFLAYQFVGIKGIAVLFVIPVVWWILKDYHRIYVIGFILIIAIDEFPGGLGEVAERSLRTSFYAKSIGISGLYAPDLILFGFIGMFLLHVWAKKTQFQFQFLSIFTFDFNEKYLIANSTFTSFDVNQKGLKLIGVFQVKLFFSMFPAYLATLVYLNHHGSEKLLKLFAAAVGVAAFVGMARFFLSPSLLLTATPVVYDSATVVLFCLVFYHLLYLLVCQEHVMGKSILTWVLLFLFLFLIVSSFRRTIWGVFAIVMFSVLFYLWSIDKRRVFNLGVVAAGLMVLLLISPIGGKIIGLVASRIFETNVDDPSTLYRFVLLKYFVESFADVPLFGHGIKPLWNEVVRLRFFEANLENVHSLFYWLVFRFGYVGFIGFGVTSYLVLKMMKRLKVIYQGTAQLHHLKIIAYFFLIYLFSGIFNPVYAQFRYAFILGVVLAYLSFLYQQHERVLGKK